jgi:hypothetical protein
LKVEKLFDIACTLTDVMACVPLEPTAFEVGPREYLHQFLTLISTLRGGDSRFLPLLLAKVNEVLPSMAAPIARPLMNLHDDQIKVEEIFEGPNSENDSTSYQTPPISLTNTPSTDSSVYFAAVNSPGLSNGGTFPDITVAAPIPRSVPRLPLTTYPD